MPEGTCLCGAAKVVVTGEPIVHLVCHCNDCRRWTGSVNYGVLYKHDQVTIEGDYLTFNLRKSQVREQPRPPKRGSQCPAASTTLKAQHGGTIDMSAVSGSAKPRFEDAPFFIE